MVEDLEQVLPPVEMKMHDSTNQKSSEQAEKLKPHSSTDKLIPQFILFFESIVSLCLVTVIGCCTVVNFCLRTCCCFQMGKKTPELNQVPDDSSRKTLTTPQDVEFVGVIITEVYFDEPVVGTDDISEKNNNVTTSNTTLNSSPRLLEKPTVSIGDDVIGSPPPLPRHQVPETETETITKHKITSNGYSEYGTNKYDKTESESVPTRPTSANEITNGHDIMVLTKQDNQNGILDTSDSSAEVNKEKNSVSLLNSASPLAMNDEKLQTTEPVSSKEVIIDQDKAILNELDNQTEIMIEQSVYENRFSPSPPPKSTSPESLPKSASPSPPPKSASLQTPPKFASSPTPPKSASSPSPPKSASSPLPPKSALSPLPPKSASSPTPPKSALSPSPPKSASSPTPPKSASLPSPPKSASPPPKSATSPSAPPKSASPPFPSKSASPSPKSDSPLGTNEEITGNKDDEIEQDVTIIYEEKDNTSLKIVNDMTIDSDEVTEKQTIENNNNVEPSNKNTEEMSDNNTHTNIYNENYESSTNRSTNNENDSNDIDDKLDKNEKNSGEEVNNNTQSLVKENKDINDDDNNDEDKNSTNVGEITQPVIEVS
ncbi:uncharacterized protein LOC142326924 [Lycorma delicatula]|uniref:uncharacterized protein LOC142326924 n=1 Tax=Lycorma delicatula TaxID=130591 RepID=UPI003F517E12